MRGGEKVLLSLARLFPEAPIFTLLHVAGSVDPELEARDIHTSFVQRLPAVARRYRHYLPLFPTAAERFDLRGFDLVVSSSHCVAKGVRPAPGAVHLCYCHTPMRYVWDRFDDYFGAKPRPLRALIAGQARRLREWDRRTAQRVDRWLANSSLVRQRLLDWYGVPAGSVQVVFPPVDVDRFAGARRLPPPEGLASGGYDLVLSALVPYKRVDLAVTAAVTAGRTLVVAGDGPERGRLERLASEARGSGRVVFAGPVGDAELPAYYGHCRSFVFPGLEDFGITPLEATAAGRPVVAYGAGGALDTVRPGLNGIFCPEQTTAAFAAALADPALDGPWDEEAMVAHARTFSRDRYRAEMSTVLAAAWREHAGAAAAATRAGSATC
jgi:glycosyltransferase involved in cell wall biosynthesis